MEPAINELRDSKRPNALIFDLDRTLVDSSCSKELRRRRQWLEVYASIPEFRVYDGVGHLLEVAGAQGLAIGIATSSYKAYAARVVEYFGFKVDTLVCYEDTQLHKPDPEPLLAAAERLGQQPEDCWSVGDEPRDMEAASRARMVSVAAAWDSPDVAALRAVMPVVWCPRPEDLAKRLSR